MPEYFYTCDGCDEVATSSFPIGTAPRELAIRCDCGGTFKRTITVPGIRFRGKGWARHPERDVANRKRGPQPPEAERIERRAIGE